METVPLFVALWTWQRGYENATLGGAVSLC